MKIGIISDTHDDITNTNKAIDIFEHNKVEVVIHAGDMISPPVINEFKRLTENGVKFFGIFGNNDGEKDGLKNAFEFIGGKLLGDIGKIEIDGGEGVGRVTKPGLGLEIGSAAINPTPKKMILENPAVADKNIFSTTRSDLIFNYYKSLS